MKCTPFYESEVKHGAKMTTEGWLLPTEFVGEYEEHTAIRERVGINDFSAMGEIDVKGTGARQFLEELCVNDVKNLKPGRIVYTAFLNEEGVMIDDTTIYCYHDNHFWVITSAPRRLDMVKWLEEKSKEYTCVSVTDISSGVGLLSVQGPKSKEMLTALVKDDLDSIQYFGFMKSHVSGIPALISRTGFTGELGFELMVNAEDGKYLWDVLQEGGKPYGAMFCGVKAGVSSIPLEKGYITIKEYGDNRTPIEVGLGWSIKWDKPYFVGKEKLLARKNEGIKNKLVGFILEDDHIKIPLGSAVIINKEVVGKVTSANYGHTVKKNIGLCFVPTALSNEGQKITIQAGEILAEAIVANKIFYDPKGEKIRSI